jgi:hypothetical protein
MTGDHAAWKQHGALLPSIDRRRDEIAAAARGPDEDTGLDHGATAPAEY